MSIAFKQQIPSYLLQCGVSYTMIRILEEQRINDEDLQTMDRDDIEHLYKNEYGFTFRDRKQFWNAIQSFQARNMKNDSINKEAEDETEDIYEIIDDDDPPKYHLAQHYRPSSLSNNALPERICSHSYTSIQTNPFEERILENDHSNVEITSASLHIFNPIIEYSQSKTLQDFQFQFPVELPKFSSKVIKAFETSNIDSEWETLLNELTHWISTKKQTPLSKRECQAIGHTLFKYYPSVGKDGYRPWSYLCKCLSTCIRKRRNKKNCLSKRK